MDLVRLTSNKLNLSFCTVLIIDTHSLNFLGLDQQTNIGSAHLGVPRPHAGASPAQQVSHCSILRACSLCIY